MFKLILLIVINVIHTSSVEVTLDDDPSLFPGHMEPLGSKQPKTEIETLSEYPTPQDFFENFIKPGRPFLLKKGAIDQRAYKLWTDEYMSSFPGASEELVQVEPNKKEIRESRGFEITLKEFISRYHNEAIYMVNSVPTFLQKDILMPPPLRCNTTRKIMLDHVTWMSSGGTKSVVHSDDLDNINCLFRGTKELLFIEPKYRSKVPIDKPRGGYSSLDVDKVNFTKYPTMREVEYIYCKMEEGDCIFIPYRWIHQVNSVANENQQNIAVNIWFRHDPDHKPEGCDVPEEKATLDHWNFTQMNSVYGGEEIEEPSLIKLFEYILSKTKFRRANIKTFISILFKVPGIFVEQSIAHLKPSKEFLHLALEIFSKLDVNEDKYFDEKDVAEITSNQEVVDSLEYWLSGQFNQVHVLLIKELSENLPPSQNEEVDESLPEKNPRVAATDENVENIQKTEL